MKQRWLTALALWPTLALGAPAALGTDGGAVVLRGVTIVDIERNRLLPRRDVIIVGDRIAGIRADGMARSPKQGRVLDGSGKFLIPGLWDFHVHVFTAPGE